MNAPRQAQIWAGPYLKQRCKQLLSGPRRPGRAWICIADHYEPLWRRADVSIARQRVTRWRACWPRIALQAQKDSCQSLPRYTFFYPEEEYRPELLDPLAEMVREGIADVEVHIHHDREGRDEFIQRILSFCHVLHERHGLLHKRDGRLRFGFIHGNWALDNSLPGGKWCGLNDEIRILGKLGCYADFTMPSGDSPSQARQLNSIYWCKDDTERPKSYDRGIPVEPGGDVQGDLMMITGPFGLRWGERLLPRMEIGALSAGDPPNAYRVHRWFELAPMVGTDVFIKLHTHGAQERNSNSLLGGHLHSLFTLVSAEARRRGCELHYVTAWEMFLAIDAVRRCLDPVETLSADRAHAPFTSRSPEGQAIGITTAQKDRTGDGMAQ